MSLNDDLENLATAAVSDWPEISRSGQLDAAIRDLYRTHLALPQFWTPEDREDYIEEWADCCPSLSVTMLSSSVVMMTDR